MRKGKKKKPNRVPEKSEDSGEITQSKKKILWWTSGHSSLIGNLARNDRVTSPSSSGGGGGEKKELSGASAGCFSLGLKTNACRQKWCGWFHTWSLDLSAQTEEEEEEEKKCPALFLYSCFVIWGEWGEKKATKRKIKAADRQHILESERK